MNSFANECLLDKWIFGAFVSTFPTGDAVPAEYHWAEGEASTGWRLTKYFSMISNCHMAETKASCGYWKYRLRRSYSLGIPWWEVLG